MFQSRESVGVAAAVVVVLGMMGFVLLRDTRAGAPGRVAADVAVNCGPYQRAVVRQTMDGPSPHVSVDCVDAAVPPLGHPADVYSPSAHPPAGLVPAVYAPRTIETAVRPRPVVRSPRAAAPAQVERARARTWQKRALIIGGSAGAGAGIGALAGGKKGALIGAAIGGGGAAIVDALRKD